MSDQPTPAPAGAPVHSVSCASLKWHACNGQGPCDCGAEPVSPPPPAEPSPAAGEPTCQTHGDPLICAACEVAEDRELPWLAERRRALVAAWHMGRQSANDRGGVDLRRAENIRPEDIERRSESDIDALIGPSHNAKGLLDDTQSRWDARKRARPSEAPAAGGQAERRAKWLRGLALELTVGSSAVAKMCVIGTRIDAIDPACCVYCRAACNMADAAIELVGKAQQPSAPPEDAEPSPVEATSAVQCEDGMTVRWCPRCGDCTCPEPNESPDGWEANPTCPIHGEASNHPVVSAPVEATLSEEQIAKLANWAKGLGGHYTLMVSRVCRELLQRRARERQR